MRQFTLSAAAGIALATLLSSASAMAQAYNDDNKGWNRGHTLITDTQGKDTMCFKAYGDKNGLYTGPQLHGKSDYATHGWQNFWGPCASASGAPEGKKTAKR
jgi:hypothetical protein